MNYLKVKGTAEELECLWQHPWGTPQLLLKHKRLPVMIVAGPGIRYNKSIVQEMPDNEEVDMTGITG
jgi:hypothetical protein